MNKKRSIGEKFFDITNVIILLFLMIVTLYPFLYVFSASLSDPLELMKSGSFLLWPKGFSLDGYRRVLINPMIPIGYKNTIILVLLGTSINLLLTSFGGYVLAYKGLYGKKLFALIIIITMFFSGGLIPLYLLVDRLGLVDSLWALMLTSAINTFNMIIMKTAFEQIPTSLSESAKMDGANDFFILFKIILPLSKSVLSVITLFYAVEHWNSWFFAMIFLRNRSNYPLQLVLREILIRNESDSMTIGLTGDIEGIKESIKYATIIIATIPVLIIYPFLQKYFVRGVMIGAVKE